MWDHSATYGDGGHCAWRGPTASIARGTGRRRRASRDWRASVARLSARSETILSSISPAYDEERALRATEAKALTCPA